MRGTVTKIRSVLCEVDCDGRTYECKARGRLVESDTGESKPVAVGDEVEFSLVQDGEGVIEEVLPRRTKLSRRSPRGQGRWLEQVIVTNVDQLLIVSAVHRPPLNMGLIDRYIIAGHAGGLDPVICVNKIDLAERDAEYMGVVHAYRELEYTVLLTSARQGTGLDDLRDCLRDKSTVLAGHSGVGKSSLLNALQPGLRLRTGPVSTKGRHVTTYASLLRLDFGGYVVDTPGIREFALWDIEKRDVAQFFPQIWELSEDCELPDCVHLHEPGCAVKRAAAEGTLPAERYDSYLRIVDTIEELDVPRATDVERPTEQVARKKREPSRRTRKQDLRRMADRQLAEDYEDEDFEGPW